jgi:benzoate/toluate 1,2-dioxygenase reductase subunit
MPHVTLIFSDGERTGFEAPSDKGILSAAHDAGIPLASDCEMGDCQTCRAQLRDGEIEIDELAFITLEDDEIDAGAVLTCVSMAQSDVVIDLPYVRASLIQEQILKVEITGIEQLSETTVGLKAKLPVHRKFQFHPGQYVNIHVPGADTSRSYSMANAPCDPHDLEFQIRLLPNGVMSDFLRRNGVCNTSLEIEGPKGIFYLRDGGGPLLMIAGGTGLAPMVSMLRHMAGSDSVEREIVLCFGVTAPGDLYYVDELKDLIGQFPNGQLRLAMTEAGADWPGHKGFVTDLVEQGDIGPDMQAYLCGPPVMIEAARKRLAGFGMQSEAIFAEEFIPSGT